MQVEMTGSTVGSAAIKAELPTLTHTLLYSRNLFSKAKASVSGPSNKLSERLSMQFFSVG